MRGDVTSYHQAILDVPEFPCYDGGNEEFRTRYRSPG